jgi:hypothetical protein
MYMRVLTSAPTGAGETWSPTNSPTSSPTTAAQGACPGRLPCMISTGCEAAHIRLASLELILSRACGLPLWALPPTWSDKPVARTLVDPGSGSELIQRL